MEQAETAIMLLAKDIDRIEKKIEKLDDKLDALNNRLARHTEIFNGKLSKNDKMTAAVIAAVSAILSQLGFKHLSP